jgi:hypothetical protein
MKERFKGIQIFLVIAISLFILAFPAYLRCNELSQIKFIRSDLSFEDPDQEEELSNKEKELKGFVPTAFFTVFLLGIKLLDPSSHLFPLSLSLRQETLILRC